MKLYDDLYCKNDSLRGGAIVTIVDQYERPIFSRYICRMCEQVKELYND